MEVLRILVVDDDRKIRAMLRRALSAEGYEVVTAADGYEALAVFDERQPDLVLLDVMMPGLSGIEVCRRLHELSSVPVLLVTAKDDVSDRVQGLDAGADDYVVKPFALEELLARVRSQFRRLKIESSRALVHADLSVDPASRTVVRGARTIELTHREFDLLAMFVQHPNQVLPRSTILERVWGFDFDSETNVLDVYIGYLRMKLESAGEPRLIHTVRGAGYVFRAPESTQQVTA